MDVLRASIDFILGDGQPNRLKRESLAIACYVRGHEAARGVARILCANQLLGCTGSWVFRCVRATSTAKLPIMRRPSEITFPQKVHKNPNYITIRARANKRTAIGVY